MLKFLSLMVLGLLLSPLSILAVDFNNYTPISATGKIPASFVRTFEEEFAEKKSGIDLDQENFETEAQTDFYESSAFLVKNMVFSGKILFNDPLSNYVKEVGAQVLESDPTLSQKIEFYTIKSPSVNAFATDQGYIFVTIGLLARLETEAQLAFILSHEATHVKKEHTLDGYVEGRKIESEKGEYATVTWREKEFAANKYSRELEEEADKFGLDNFFSSSNYSYESIPIVFDILREFFLPYEQRIFSADFFENKHLTFPKKLLLDSIQEVSFEKIDESQNTHPDLDKRKDYIKEKAEKAENKNRKSFIIGKNRFDEVIKIARFELSGLLFDNYQYADALYNCYLNTSLYGSDPYNDRIKLQSLYVLSKYRNCKKNIPEMMLPPWQITSGESQRLNYFLENLDSKQQALLTISLLFENYNIKKEHVFLDMGKDLLAETILHYNIPRNEFSDTSIYIYNAFTDLLQEQEFETALNEAYLVKKSDLKIRYYSPNNLSKKQKRQGLKLGVEKMVFVDPNIIKLKEKGEINIKYSESEKANIALNDAITDNTERLKLNSEIIDDHLFDENSIEKYNEYCFLSQYIAHLTFHSNNGVQIVNLNRNQTETITKKYDTDKFIWTGFLSIKTKRPFLVYAMAIYPLAWPFIIYKLLQPSYYTIYYYLLVDLDNNHFIWKDSHVFRSADTDPIIKGKLFDSIYQTKKIMRTALLCIALSMLSIHGVTFAQAGYLGKKTEFQCFGSVKKSNYTTYSKADKGPMGKLGFSLDRIISRKNAIGLEYETYRSSFYYESKIGDRFIIPEYRWDELPPTKMFASSYYITFTQYLKGMEMAVLASFIKLGVGKSILKGVYNDSGNSFYLGETSVLSVKISAGRKTMLNDFLSFSFSFDLILSLDYTEYDYSNTLQNGLVEAHKGGQGLNFTLALGFLTK